MECPGGDGEYQVAGKTSSQKPDNNEDVCPDPGILPKQVWHEHRSAIPDACNAAGKTENKRLHGQDDITERAIMVTASASKPTAIPC